MAQEHRRRRCGPDCSMVICTTGKGEVLSIFSVLPATAWLLTPASVSSQAFPNSSSHSCFLFRADLPYPSLLTMLRFWATAPDCLRQPSSVRHSLLELDLALQVQRLQAEQLLCVLCGKMFRRKNQTFMKFALAGRSSSGRSYLRPLGYEQLAWVADANRMVSRAVLLQALVSMKDNIWVLEQPEGLI